MKFQESMIKHNLELSDIKFSILEECREDYLNQTESYWIQRYEAISYGTNISTQKRRETSIIIKEGNEKLVSTIKNNSIPRTININLEISGLILGRGGVEFRRNNVKDVKTIKRNDFIFTIPNQLTASNVWMNESGEILVENSEANIFVIPYETLEKMEEQTLFQENISEKYLNETHP